MLRIARDVRVPVSIIALREPMSLAAYIVAGVYEDFGMDCWITSGNDGKHSKGSLHYKGLALDFRTRIVPKAQRPALAEAVREALGPQFDVVLESHHLHVEFDPDSA